jgi:hypothetical protein
LTSGTWGSLDGNEGLKVDSTKIVLERWCEGGTFPQPTRLDREGRFAVLGQYLISIGPGFGTTAILIGSTDGRTASLSVRLIDGSSRGSVKTYVLGTPYTLPPGTCPIEY